MHQFSSFDLYADEKDSTSSSSDNDDDDGEEGDRKARRKAKRQANGGVVSGKNSIISLIHFPHFRSAKKRKASNAEETTSIAAVASPMDEDVERIYADLYRQAYGDFCAVNDNNDRSNATNRSISPLTPSTPKPIESAGEVIDNSEEEAEASHQRELFTRLLSAMDNETLL